MRSDALGFVFSLAAEIEREKIWRGAVFQRIDVRRLAERRGPARPPRRWPDVDRRGGHDRVGNSVLRWESEVVVSE